MDTVTNTIHGVWNKLYLAFFISPLWVSFTAHFHDFAISGPVTILLLFWFLDMVFGVWIACRDRVFEKRKMASSFKKLFGYMCWLGVAFCFLYSGLTLAAQIINAAVLLTEGTSVIINSADVSGDEKLKKLSARIERQMEN